MKVGDRFKRDDLSEPEKAAFIREVNASHLAYKSEDGWWEVIAPPDEPDYAAEIMALKNYLNETDKHAIKCAERGLEMKYEYPAEYVERQNARDRINELERLLGGNI